MKYEKKCKNCGVLQSYTTKRALDHAIKNNTICRRCSFDKKINNDVNYRKCPTCDDIIHYSTKYHAKNSEKLGTKCRKCSYKYADRSVYKTDEYRKKISKVTSGKNNPMYGKTVYDVWVEKYGIEEANRLETIKRNKLSTTSSGKNNPMYGKPAPIGSGNGWGGWYKGCYFRSLHELSMMYWMDEYCIKWSTAEVKEYTVYIENSSYRADFVVGNVLIEVKPKRLQCLKENKLKEEVFIEFCRSKGMRYKIVDPTIINIDTIKYLIDRNIVVFNQKTVKKYQQFLQRS